MSAKAWIYPRHVDIVSFYSTPFRLCCENVVDGVDGEYEQGLYSTDIARKIEGDKSISKMRIIRTGGV